MDVVTHGEWISLLLGVATLVAATVTVLLHFQLRKAREESESALAFLEKASADKLRRDAEVIHALMGALEPQREEALVSSIATARRIGELADELNGLRSELEKHTNSTLAAEGMEAGGGGEVEGIAYRVSDHPPRVGHYWDLARPSLPKTFGYEHKLEDLGTDEGTDQGTDEGTDEGANQGTDEEAQLGQAAQVNPPAKERHPSKEPRRAGPYYPDVRE